MLDISVLLVDDQPLLRAGFRMVLEEEPDLVVVGEASDGDEAVRLAATLSPDVVLMDIRMPGTDGIEATRQIVLATPASKVLILTTFDLDEYAFTALRFGASGFLLKDVPPAELARAIRTVAGGDAVVAPCVTRRLLDAYAHRLPDLRLGAASAPDPGLAMLTEREIEILVEVAGGLSNREVAAKLFVAEATVKTHLGRILSKLGLRDRVQAVVYAYQTGLVRPGAPD
jgi:DNA-binding NarL/FixJ family response regulator